MWRLLGVSRTGYPQWRRRPPSAHAQANTRLDAQVAAIHAASKGSYGRPRIVRELREQGLGRPSKPTDNAFIESFNGTLRDECLNAHWFTMLDDAKEKIEAWRQEYNVSRPHRALGEIPPTEFAQRFRDLAAESKDKGSGD